METTNSELKHRGAKPQNSTEDIGELSADAYEDETWKTNLDDQNDPKMTLMEQVYLLALKDKEGYPSFWNDSLSYGLRNCVLVELAIRGRIGLEPAGLKQKPLGTRKVVLKSDASTGDIFLDETLKHIKNSPNPENIHTWAELLSGETWNYKKLKYQLKHVRERLAKNLAEKGIVTTEKTNFFLFDMTTHPLLDKKVKDELVTNVKDFFLKDWTNDLTRMDHRKLALVVLASASDVLENALEGLSDDDYDLAMKRMETLMNWDVEKEAKKAKACEVFWAVFKNVNN